jgi:hypothetical protein
MGAPSAVLGSSAVSRSAVLLCDALANDRHGEDGGFACSCLVDAQLISSGKPYQHTRGFVVASTLERPKCWLGKPEL